MAVDHCQLGMEHYWPCQSATAVLGSSGASWAMIWTGGGLMTVTIRKGTYGWMETPGYGRFDSGKATTSGASNDSIRPMASVKPMFIQDTHTCKPQPILLRAIHAPFKAFALLSLLYVFLSTSFLIFPPRA